MMRPRSPALRQPHMTLGKRSQRIGSMWKLPLPVARKHPPRSPRAREPWSGLRPGDLRCVVGGHLHGDRCPLCRWARDGGGFWQRRDTPHARRINRRLATLFYAVTKNRPIQGCCDAEWDRCVGTASRDRIWCSPGTFRSRRGSDPGAQATKLRASRCLGRAHPVVVT